MLGIAFEAFETLEIAFEALEIAFETLEAALGVEAGSEVDCVATGLGLASGESGGSGAGVVGSARGSRACVRDAESIDVKKLAAAGGCAVGPLLSALEPKVSSPCCSMHTARSQSGLVQVWCWFGAGLAGL